MTSRNRPRNGSTKGDAGEHEEEQQMWEAIKSSLQDLSEIQKRQIEVFNEFQQLEKEVAERAKADEEDPTVAEIEAIQKLYREQSKLTGDEQRMLNEGPHDVISRLEILKAMREASSEAQTLAPTIPGPRNATSTKVRKQKPLPRPASGPSSQAGLSQAATSQFADKEEAHGTSSLRERDRDKDRDRDASSVDGAPETPASIPGRLKNSSSVRSSSVNSRRDATVDSEVRAPEEAASSGGPESARGTNAERAGKLTKGAEVAYKQTRPKEDGSQWIQCIITAVHSGSSPKRYEVQDPEPEEAGAGGGTKYRTSAQQLIAIPTDSDKLPDYPVGKQVLARYPETTTFYRAEVLGSRREKGESYCVLRFEEDDQKESSVVRRYVLDVGGK